MALSIYIHIPFCVKKCPYCDFYSVSYREKLAISYANAVIRALDFHKNKLAKIDTVYFGGGTPNLIGAKLISMILSSIKSNFTLLDDAEITMEANPETFCKQNISDFAAAGVNRLSLGLQSSNPNELKHLGRTHTPEEVLLCIDKAKKTSISNISLDLMIGIEGQTFESLKNSIDFCAEAGANHISAYLLKIEPGTPFYKRKALMNLPSDDESADIYEFTCNELIKKGYEQYEISNFAKDSKISKHNTKYWLCEEYLGIGAAAHGFLNGRRYFYERNIEGFIENPLKTVSDGNGGQLEERIMLNLRLSKGISREDYKNKFGYIFSEDFDKLVNDFCKMGLMKEENNTFSLTQKGFLVSNTVICDLLELI